MAEMGDVMLAQMRRILGGLLTVLVRTGKCHEIWKLLKQKVIGNFLVEECAARPTFMRLSLMSNQHMLYAIESWTIFAFELVLAIRCLCLTLYQSTILWWKCKNKNKNSNMLRF